MLIQAMSAVLDRVEEVDLAAAHMKRRGEDAVAARIARTTVVPAAACARHSGPPRKESPRPPHG